MWTLNATADSEYPCYFVGNPNRAPNCTGTIRRGAWFDYRNYGIEGQHIRTCRDCVRHLNDRKETNDGHLLVKVELTYSDGSRRVLEDEAASDWFQSVNGVIDIQSLRRGGERVIPASPWKHYSPAGHLLPETEA